MPALIFHKVVVIQVGTYYEKQQLNEKTMMRVKNVLLAMAIIFCATSNTMVQAQEKAEPDSLSMAAMLRMLPEATVKAERPVVKAERGRLNYNMPWLLEKMPADNAYEALTRIPGVSDNDGKIEFAGRDVTLVIDGKTTTLTQEQLVERLKSMPASRVAKAEVMPTAPASMHVRGMAINVVTKDYAGTNHLSGQISNSWEQNKYGAYTGTGNLIWQHGKLGVDAQYTFYDGISYSEKLAEANHPLNGGRVPYNENTLTKGDGLKHNFRMGLDYAFSKKHRLEVAYTGGWGRGLSNCKTMGNSVSDVCYDSHKYLHNIEINYTLPFGLRFSGSYTGYRNPERQTMDGRMEDTDKSMTADSKQKIDKWMFSLDQTHSLGTGWEISYGVKGQFAGNESWQTSLDKDGNEMPDATSSVDVNERIWDVYAGFSKQFSEAFSVDASVEAEQYHSPVWDEWYAYPSLNALWNVNPDNILNLSFSSNSSFPSYWAIMSSVSYISPYSEVWGNPNLKPSSSYNVNLMWQFKRRYTLSLFANISPDYFGQLPYQPSDRMAVAFKMVNYNHKNEYGLRASAQYRLGAWLNGNVFVVGLYDQERNDNFDLPFDRSRFVAILSGTMSAKLSKKESLFFILNPLFQSKAIQGVYDIQPIFMMSASLKWTSRNNKWSVSANGSHLFNNDIDTRSVQGNQDYRMKLKNIVSGTLSVIYRFGNFKAKQVKAVDTSRMGH